MILVDTSIWVDHFRTGDRVLSRLLEGGLVLHHPWVTGEVALGHLVQRQEILVLLGSLPPAPVAEPAEILVFVERHQLMGRGVGYVDVHLLAAAQLAGATIWTRDTRLAAVATLLGQAVEPRAVEP